MRFLHFTETRTAPGVNNYNDARAGGSGQPFRVHDSRARGGETSSRGKIRDAPVP